MFPVNDIDIRAAADAYTKYPDFIHKNGDNTILMLMACLREEFNRIRSAGGSSSGTYYGAKSPLEIVTKQAEVLISFCDEIKSTLKRTNTISTLNDMKNEFYR